MLSLKPFVKINAIQKAYLKDWKFNLSLLKKSLQEEDAIQEWLAKTEEWLNSDVNSSAHACFNAKMLKLCQAVGIIFDNQLIDYVLQQHNNKLTVGRSDVEKSPIVTIGMWIADCPSIRYNQEGHYEIETPRIKRKQLDRVEIKIYMVTEISTQSEPAPKNGLHVSFVMHQPKGITPQPACVKPPKQSKYDFVPSLLRREFSLLGRKSTG